jgi:uncharacterized protein
MEINQSESGSKGKFQALENGTQIGLMTYSIAGEDKIIIDHTEVIPAYNGKGIGKKMVVKAVEFARKNNIKILPLCPFARGVFARNKDLRDVLV